MESCLSAFRSPARIPRNKVLCGYDPQQLWNSLVDNGGPREPSFPHFLIQLIQRDAELSPQRGTVSSALKSVRLCDGQSVRPRPVPCVVFFFGCQNQSCLRHVTNLAVLVLADVTRPQDTLHLLLCGQKPWEVTQGETERGREIHPARD